MNTSIKFSLVSTFAALVFPAIVGCAAGDTGSDVCTKDFDCQEDGFPICDLDDGACVPSCAVEGNECEAPETCNADNYCSDETPGEGEGEGEGETDECDIDDDCYGTDELCDEAATPTTCEDPDVLLGTCTEANAFGTRETDGPLIYDLTLERTAGIDSDCAAAVAGTTGYTASFSYHDRESDAYTDSTTDENTAYSVFKFSRDGTNDLPATLPLTIVGIGTVGNDGVVDMPICFMSAPASIAVQIEDKAGNVSNAACSGL